MKPIISLASVILFTASLLSCTPATPAQQGPALVKPNRPTSPAIRLSAADERKIGMKIWQNECGGTVAGLTSWNKGEEFPSMGIGHFIWYPKGFNGRWTESFPQFVAFAKASKAQGLPAWVQTTLDCPWNSRAAFLADANGPKLTELRKFLAGNVELQTRFIVLKSVAALKRILTAAPADQRARIFDNYRKVASTANGTYALIDYVNFKGEGINPTERYNNQGWGLMQVLANMKQSPGGQASAAEFAESAKRMLGRRIANSPKARGEERWRNGWNNRCDSYKKPL